MANNNNPSASASAPPALLAFHHVALWSTQFDRTVAFYQNALGMTPIYQWGGAPQRAIIIRASGEGKTASHVEIFERPTDENANEKNAPTADENQRLLHFALTTDDVDGCYHAALAAGATSQTEPFNAQQENKLPNTEFLKVRIAFVRGINGEVIEFFQDLNPPTVPPRD